MSKPTPVSATQISVALSSARAPDGDGTARGVNFTALPMRFKQGLAQPLVLALHDLGVDRPVEEELTPLDVLGELLADPVHQGAQEQTRSGHGPALEARVTEEIVDEVPHAGGAGLDHAEVAPALVVQQVAMVLSQGEGEAGHARARGLEVSATPCR